MNDTKICSNGITKWLSVRSFAAFLLAVTLSFSCVLASPSLTAYALTDSDYAKYIQEIKTLYDGTSDIESCVYYAIRSDQTVLLSSNPLYYRTDTYNTTSVYNNGLVIYYDGTSFRSTSHSGDGYSYYTGAGVFFDDTLVWSNYDVINFDTNEVFFHPERPLVIVAKMITPEKVLGQILGLLPLLIPFLVGLAAFWKGLRFLFSLLRKA